MALRFTNEIMGTVVIRQYEDDEPRKFNIQIRRGNALAVLIHPYKNERGEAMLHLYHMFPDAKYMENLIKNDKDVFFDEVASIKLNMYYKECKTLLKYFVISGHKVTCFYRAPKRKK